MNLISRHLNRKNLKLPIHQINTICAFTGEKINEGIAMKDLIKKTFTDYEYIKYKSEYASIDIALLIEAVIQGDKCLNAIRNYSFFATEKKLKLLQRDEICDLLFNIPEKPFQLGITYSNKKHIAYKTPINFDTNNYQICTDLGMINFSVEKAKEIYPILQNWYTISKNTAQEPTFFTKSEIFGLSVPNHAKVTEYGIERYFEENKLIEPYRNTAFLKLLVYILNKKSI